MVPARRAQSGEAGGLARAEGAPTLRVRMQRCGRQAEHAGAWGEQGTHASNRAHDTRAGREGTWGRTRGGGEADQAAVAHGVQGGPHKVRRVAKAVRVNEVEKAALQAAARQQAAGQAAGDREGGACYGGRRGLAIVNRLCGRAHCSVRLPSHSSGAAAGSVSSQQQLWPGQGMGIL